MVMRWSGMGGGYLALVAQPAVACKTGAAVEAVDSVGAVAAVSTVEPVSAVEPVGSVEPVGAAVEAIEPVDAETGDLRDEAVCSGHGWKEFECWIWGLRCEKVSENVRGQ